MFTHLDVQAPAVHKPSPEEFFSEEDPEKPNIVFLKNHFYREGRITEEQALFIINKGTEILKQEPNLLEVEAPITGTWIAFYFHCCCCLIIITIHYMHIYL